MSHPDLPRKARELSCKFTVSIVRLLLGIFSGFVAVFLKEVIGVSDNTALVTSLALLITMYSLTMKLPHVQVLKSPGKFFYGVPSMFIGYLLGVIIASQVQ